MVFIKVGYAKYYYVGSNGFMTSKCAFDALKKKHIKILEVSNIDHELELTEHLKHKENCKNIFIPSVKSINSNIYYHDSYNVSKVNDIVVNSPGLPPVLVTPQFVFTKEKSSPIKISAIFNTKKAPKACWYIDEKLIHGCDNYKFEISSDDVGNYIVSITIKNYGLDVSKKEFKCLISNENGVNEISFSIAFDKPYGTPCFMEMPKIYVIDIGNGQKTVVVKVLYYSEFTPYIVWSKDGRKYFYNNNDTRTAYNKKLNNNNEYECEFLIPNFTDEDYGGYYFYFVTRYGYEVFTIGINECLLKKFE